MTDLQADLNLVRDAFERFDLLDDRVRFLQGPRRRHRSPTRGSSSIALLRLGAGIGADGARRARSVVRQARARRLRHRRRRTRIRRARAAVEAFRDRARHQRDRSSASTGRRQRGARSRPRRDRHERSARRPTPRRWACRSRRRRRATPSTSRSSSSSTTCDARRRARCSRCRACTSKASTTSPTRSSSSRTARTRTRSSDAEFVESFGPSSATSTSATTHARRRSHALNLGIKEGRGQNFALMIDGAHVLTPGVLRFGLAGLADLRAGHRRDAAVVRRPRPAGRRDGRRLRPGVRRPACSDEIHWPESGYRLFEIGHFVGGRDWLDGVWESNCMFVPRAQLEQVGGFDENFSMPGGGFANLDLYERLGSSPDVTVVSIIGEGSFHQLHGGIDHQPSRRRRTRATASSATASTSPSCAAVASAGRASRSTTSAGSARRAPAAPVRGG